jgi:hypothetical protein
MAAEPTQQQINKMNATRSAAALAATRKQTANIVKNQKPLLGKNTLSTNIGLSDLDVLGLQGMYHNILHNAQNPNELLYPKRHAIASIKNGQFVDAQGNVVPPDAGIAMPGTGGRLGAKLLGRFTPAEENIVLGGASAATPELNSLRQLRKSAYTTAQKIRDAQHTDGGFGPSLLTQKAAINRAGRAAQAKAYEDVIAGGGTHEEAVKAMGGKFDTIPLPANYAPGWSANDLKYLKDYAQTATNDTFKKMRANEALNKIAGGEVPQRAEVQNIIDVFGTEFKRAQKQINGWMMAKEGFYNVLNAPRTLQATADVSGTFRQALQAGVTHPILWAQNLKPQFKSLLSEDYYHSFVHGIATDPKAELYKRAGLRITEIGKSVSRAQREEAYQSPWLEEIRRGHRITGAPSAVIRASGRAYTAVLDGLRRDMFNHLYDDIEGSGRLNGMSSEEYDHFLKSLGEYVNNATGQGGKSFGRHAASLNAFFWSPRLLASRANLINPLYYAGLHPAVRQEALLSLASMMAFAGTTLGIAHKLGLSVNLNPRSSDFAKIRHGGVRIDALAGMTQLPVLISRVATQQKQSTITGVTQNLTGAIGKGSVGDVLVSFARGKANPALGIPLDWAFNKTVTGQPFNLKNEIVSHVTPLSFQDAASVGDITKPSNAPQIAAGLIGSGLGIGIQSYSANQSATEKSLIKAAKDAGVWHSVSKLPPAVVSDITAKTKFDAETGNYSTYKDKVEKVVLPAYAARYPQFKNLGKGMNTNLPESVYKKLYTIFIHGKGNLPPLFPAYETYNNAIHTVLEAKLQGK